MTSKSCHSEYGLNMISSALIRILVPPLFGSPSAHVWAAQQKNRTPENATP